MRQNLETRERERGYRIASSVMVNIPFLLKKFSKRSEDPASSCEWVQLQ